VSYLEVARYMRNQLLRDSDVMSMAWSLELRVPFVDVKLIGALQRIPARFRLAPKKRMLLSAVPEIPQWVRERPKQGFVFPFKEWLTGEWQEIFQRIKMQSPIALKSWYRCWCLFALEDFVTRKPDRDARECERLVGCQLAPVEDRARVDGALIPADNLALIDVRSLARPTSKSVSCSLRINQTAPGCFC